MARQVKVARALDLAPGQSRLIQVEHRELLLFNVEGRYYAVKNSCPHRGTPLDHAGVENRVLTCPGHGWEFDLETGDSLDHPPLGLRCYRVEVRDDTVWIEVP
jgi:nitrite reductase/ring-hydroxylating ferredoxin subunit